MGEKHETCIGYIGENMDIQIVIGKVFVSIFGGGLQSEDRCHRGGDSNLPAARSMAMWWIHKNGKSTTVVKVDKTDHA